MIFLPRNRRPISTGSRMGQPNETTPNALRCMSHGDGSTDSLYGGNESAEHPCRRWNRQEMETAQRLFPASPFADGFERPENSPVDLPSPLGKVARSAGRGPQRERARPCAVGPWRGGPLAVVGVLRTYRCALRFVWSTLSPASRVLPRCDGEAFGRRPHSVPPHPLSPGRSY